MFHLDLNALLRVLERSLRPGGRLVAHEDVPWETFGLQPGGVAVARFSEAVTDSMPRDNT
jgi:hypothetical protein